MRNIIKISMLSLALTSCFGYQEGYLQGTITNLQISDGNLYASAISSYQTNLYKTGLNDLNNFSAIQGYYDQSVNSYFFSNPNQALLSFTKNGVTNNVIVNSKDAVGQSFTAPVNNRNPAVVVNGNIYYLASQGMYSISATANPNDNWIEIQGMNTVNNYAITAFGNNVYALSNLGSNNIGIRVYNTLTSTWSTITNAKMPQVSFSPLVAMTATANNLYIAVNTTSNVGEVYVLNFAANTIAPLGTTQRTPIASLITALTTNGNTLYTAQGNVGTTSAIKLYYCFVNNSNC